MSQPLRLRAEDADDFRVIAACLQDALVPAGEMHFLADEKAFVLVANRFRWENCSETFDAPFAATPQPDDVPDAMFVACNNYERVNCAIRFDGVTHVRRRRFDPKDRGRILELLTIRAENGGVELLFADDVAIRLEGEKVLCRLHDLGDPWPTMWRPRHAAEDAA